jgi:hypothetical protein
LGPLKAARIGVRSQHGTLAPSAFHLHAQLAPLLRSEPKGIPLFFSEVHGHIEYLPIAKLPVVCVVARVGVSSMGDCWKCQTSAASPAEPGGLPR